MLPYLLSERAPHWNPMATGVYVGLTRAHRRAHLVRAALEGVCQQLALVLDAVCEAGYPVSDMRATGGLLRDHRVRQLLTDVIGRDIGFTAATDGSAFGAALLGMEALGLIDSLEVAADLVPVVEILRPDEKAAATYRRQRSVFDGLFDTLAPTFRTLHEQGQETPGRPAP
jgi:gluconokinase